MLPSYLFSLIILHNLSRFDLILFMCKNLQKKVNFTRETLYNVNINECIN